MQTGLPSVLLVDDDAEMQSFLQRVLAHENYQITSCSSGEEALKILTGEGKQTFDVILSDVRMPQIDGFTLVDKLREAKVETPIILMTAHGTISAAVTAIKRGAHDYLTKPLQINDVKETLKRTIEFQRTVGASASTNNTSAPAEAVLVNTAVTDNGTNQSAAGGSQNLIGHNAIMREVINLARRVGSVDATVLILGESGTGKEVIAQSIHQQGKRRSQKFIPINCAAIPGELLESELFGHAKGSFTGATTQKKGLFEEADGGTLFLDEIGDLPLPLQAKLLRVLQEKQIRAVGSNTTKNIDVRIIAATHRDLRIMMLDGKFREDLYYRLSVIPIVIPPLRERAEDIVPLAELFLKKTASKLGVPLKTLSETAKQKLMVHAWKGNVRELENVIERAMILSQKNVIEVGDLSFLDDVQEAASSAQSVVINVVDHQKSLSLKEIEKEALVLALQKSGGKKEEAAKILGISRKTLYRKEREYGLTQ